MLYILDMSNDGWWKAKCGDATGLIPSNYGIVQLNLYSGMVVLLYCSDGQ